MITLQMHLHSIGSKDSLMQPGRIVEVATRKGIDKLFITDHNHTGLRNGFSKYSRPGVGW